MKKLNEQDHQFLKACQDSEFQAIDQFDKIVLTLTGGAFGVSFAFLKDIVRPDAVTHQGFLVAAWVFWCLTLSVNLTSFYFSHLAMRRAQRKYRAGERDEAKLNGIFGSSVVWLNPSAGALFILGLICMSVFVTTNLYAKSTTTPTLTAGTPATTTTNSTSANPTSPAAPDTGTARYTAPGSTESTGPASARSTN